MPHSGFDLGSKTNENEAKKKPLLGRRQYLRVVGVG